MARQRPAPQGHRLAFLSFPSAPDAACPMIPRWVGSAEMIIQSNFLDLTRKLCPPRSCCLCQASRRRRSSAGLSRPQKDQPAEARRPGPTAPSGLGGSRRCTGGGAEGQDPCDETRRAPPGSPAPGPPARSRAAGRHPQCARVRGFASAQAGASPADSHPGDPLPSLPCCV